MALLLALGFASLKLAGIFGAQISVGEWLFWRYALSWLGAAAFSLASLSVGHVVVRALSPRGYRADGHFVLAFGTGVLVFGWAVFLVGLLGLLGPVAFVLIPLALFAVGAGPLGAELRRVRDQARAAGGLFASVTPWGLAALGVGAIALAAIYVPTLVPDNAAYDARWYHLGLAEHYASGGAIRRFPEGPITGTVPHLASLLYTWAWLLPGGQLFDRVELCAHLELACFVATLSGVPVLVRHFVPGSRATFAWVAVFLWPSLFIYDTTLTSAADHIGALYAIPIHLTLMRALRTLSPRDAALFALQLSAAVLVKYTAAVLLAPLPLIAILVRAAWLTVRPLGGSSRASALGSLAVTVVVGLVATSMHWLKNWIWYGDPAYPVLHRVFTERPWTADGDHHYALYQATNFAATGPWSDRLTGAFKALYDHSYGLYNWADFHGKMPVFGSLFTFSLFALPLLPRTLRIWISVLSIHLGIALWFLVSHQERYLQALLPCMAAATVAILILAWRAGAAARVGVVALVSVQAIWCLGIQFWPLHKMTGRSGLESAITFFARSYSHSTADRTEPFSPLSQVAAKLPPFAKVLIHHTHLRTGIGAMSVTDAVPIAFGLSYSRVGSSSKLDALLKSWKVTHVLWDTDTAHGADSVAGDLVFHTYVARHVTPVGRFGGMTLGTLPLAPPTDEGSSVLYMGCPGAYANGLYRLEDLSVPATAVSEYPQVFPAPRRSAAAGDVAALAVAASHAVIDRKCASSVSIPDFTVVARHGTVDFAVRTNGVALGSL